MLFPFGSHGEVKLAEVRENFFKITGFLT